MDEKIEVREKKVMVSVVGTATLICRRFYKNPKERGEIDNDWRKALYDHPDGVIRCSKDRWMHRIWNLLENNLTAVQTCSGCSCYIRVSMGMERFFGSAHLPK